MEALSQEWIAEKKKQFKRIMKINIGGDMYVYRFVTNSDMDNINTKYKDAIDPETGNLKDDKNKEFENDILKISVLYPENFDPEKMPYQAKSTLLMELTKAGMVLEEPTEL